MVKTNYSGSADLFQKYFSLANVSLAKKDDLMLLTWFSLI